MPIILVRSDSKWPTLAGKEIQKVANKYLTKKRKCSIILTGVTTATRLCTNLAQDSFWDHSKIEYYFGDERCIFSNHFDSNYGMV